MMAKGENLSIHPRSWLGFPRGEKHNTCKAPSKSRLLRVKTAIEEHLDRHPADTASRTHLDKVNARLDSGAVSA